MVTSTRRTLASVEPPIAWTGDDCGRPASRMGRVIPESWAWRTRDETLDVWPGRHQELGATWGPEATNFAVSAPEATAVWVCLFDEDGTETRHQLTEHTLGVWNGQVPGVHVGQRYGFRAEGPWDPRHGRRYNPHKLLLDPYALRDHRRAHAGPGAARPRRRRQRPQHGRLGAVDAAQRRGARRVRLGRRPSDAPALARHRDLRAARQGLHPAAQRGPRAPARNLRRARHPHGDRLPQRPRGHRGRADAGAPVLHRAGRRRPRDEQLLGLQLDRLLRPARRLQLLRATAVSR